MTRRRGPTLAERSAGRADDPPRADGGRHCWVVDSPGHPGRWAGLLVEWRRVRDGWQGRVVYAVPEPTGDGTRLVERWLDSGYLRAEHLDDRGR